MAGRKKQSRTRPQGKPNQKDKQNVKGKPNKWADHYTRQARKDQYPARSVYKLKEIQKKHRLIRPGQRVLDLGCAPGAWLLFAAEQVGTNGRVIGIDLKPITIRLPRQARTIIADIRDNDADYRRTIGQPVDLVISDLAPATTGNKIVDTTRSLELCQTALEMANLYLAPGGAFVCKLFQGPDVKLFVESVKPRFRRYDLFKPHSSRKASREIYIIGLTFLGGNHVGT